MKIACIGNAVFDYSVSSDKDIIIDERNSYEDAFMNVGGPASTAASVITKFGSKVDFYGRVGNDLYGNYICNKMQQENINLNHLVVSDEIKTPFSFVTLNTKTGTRTIQTVRSRIEYNNPYIGFDDIENNYDYILTDGKYAKDTFALILKNLQAVTIIDAGRVNDEVLKLCSIVDYIICSQDFAEKVTNISINGEYENNVLVFNKMKEIFNNAKGITITVGKRGYICEKNGEVIVNPSYNSGLPVVDTNGAGDIFHGAFTYAIANGYDYYDALEFANITASLSVSKIGGRDSCPNLWEIENVLNKKNNQNKQFVKRIS